MLTRRMMATIGTLFSGISTSKRYFMERTYTAPTTKTPRTATLVAVGIRRPRKIQKGSASTATSVMIAIADWMMWKLLSMQTVSGSSRNSGFQLVWIGRHWNRAPKKTAMACKMLKIIRAHMALKSAGWCPPSRSRKTRMEALTRASTGLYHSW